MAPELPITLAGESVHLLGARALYWPARDALLIADLHLGKADLFRRSGIGLPSGGTSDDLQRLGAVVQLPKADLGIELLGERIQEGPFLLRHAPQPQPGLHVLCGHLHPLARLPGMQRRWPAFWMRDGMTILPAFSGFTAGIAPVLASGERLVACVEDQAIALPAR